MSGYFINVRRLISDAIGLIYSAFSAAGGAALIGFLQSGIGSVFRLVSDKLRERVSVKDFGAVGDWNGSTGTDDLAAFRAAFAAHKKVFIPAGRYYFGSTAEFTIFVDLSLRSDDISIVTDGFVELVCNTTADVVPRFFNLENNSNFNSGPIRFTDIGGNLDAPGHRGAVGFYLFNPSGGNWGNVNIEAVSGKNLTACVIVAGAIEAANRIRGIHIGQVFSDYCYYGFNAQNQGDSVVIDNLIAYQNYRAYFVYGVTDHEVNIFSRNSRSGSGIVNISRSDGGLDTKGIDVRYVGREQIAVNNHVLINHIGTGTGGTTAGTIRNISLNLDIDDTNNPLKVVTYTASGGAETGVSTANIVDNIRVSGAFPAAITCTATYTTKGYFEVNGQYYNASGTLGCVYDSSIANNFNLAKSLAYTPTWTASGTAPSLGNGTLTGNFVVKNGMCFLTIVFYPGSTTAFGTGTWSFGLPYGFRSQMPCVGSAKIFDAGVANILGICEIASGAGVMSLTANAQGTGLSPASPMIWTNGDYFQTSVVFPIY